MCNRSLVAEMSSNQRLVLSAIAYICVWYDCRDQTSTTPTRILAYEVSSRALTRVCFLHQPGVIRLVMFDKPLATRAAQAPG